MAKDRSNTGRRKAYTFEKRDVRENIQYYLMMCIPLILIFIFSYLPLFGIVIAFQDYVSGKPFFGEGVTWVGLKWFKIRKQFPLRVPAWEVDRVFFACHWGGCRIE